MIIPPPPEGDEPAFAPPPPVTAAGKPPLPVPESDQDSIEALFTPPPFETEESVKAPETKAPQEPVTAQAPVAAQTPAAEEKIEVTLTPKPAPAQTAAKASPAKPKPLAAAPKSEAPFIRDPRFRLWILASLAWNMPQNTPPVSGGADSPYKRQPIDLREFPKNQG
jgi:hypothetical protein